MILNNHDGTTSTYDKLEGLFKAKRSVRNELFGSYLTEVNDDGSINASVVLTKVDEKIKSYELYLDNLKALRVEVSRLAADEEAKKLQGTVDDMSKEKAQALFEQLKKKLEA